MDVEDAVYGRVAEMNDTNNGAFAFGFRVVVEDRRDAPVIVRVSRVMMRVEHGVLCDSPFHGSNRLVGLDVA